MVAPSAGRGGGAGPSRALDRPLPVVLPRGSGDGVSLKDVGRTWALAPRPGPGPREGLGTQPRPRGWLVGLIRGPLALLEAARPGPALGGLGPRRLFVGRPVGALRRARFGWAREPGTRPGPWRGLWWWCFLGRVSLWAWAPRAEGRELLNGRVGRGLGAGARARAHEVVAAAVAGPPGTEEGTSEWAEPGRGPGPRKGGPGRGLGAAWAGLFPTLAPREAGPGVVMGGEAERGGGCRAGPGVVPSLGGPFG